MTDIALGVVVLNRVDKLTQLLESVEGTVIDTVYVADNGTPSTKKQTLFTRDFDFHLEVIDLDYNIGLGPSRDAIVNEVDEEYLLIADSDHEIIADISRLVSILEFRDDIGGVAGSVVEPERGRIWQSAKDFSESGSRLLRSADFRSKTVERVAGSIFISFDFIPYPTLYRREALEDYSWDPNYPLGRAHADLYVGHWKGTDWVFGICPQVHFGHYPGGDQKYISHRRNEEKYRKAKSHFRQKWGYKSIESIRGYWYDTSINPGIIEKSKQIYDEQGIITLLNEGANWVEREFRRRL